MAADERQKNQQINFNGLNAEFGILQNIELDMKNFDGEYADLESPAITKCKGALRKLTYDNGYTSIRKGLRFKRANQDLIVFALSKNTLLTSGIATGGSNTTLVKTSAGWTIDAYKNKYLKYTLSNQDYYILVTSNTADTLSFGYTTIAPANLTTFKIYEPDDLYVYDINANTLTLLKANLAPYRKWTGVAYNSYVGTPIETGGDTVFVAEDTATGGTTLTLVKTAAAWTINAYTDKIVKYTINNQDYYLKIKSNTADTLTFTKTSIAPASGTKFTIYSPIKPYISGTWTSVGVYTTVSNTSNLTNTSLTYFEDALYGRYIYTNITDVNNAGDLYLISHNLNSNIYVTGNSVPANGKAYKIIHSAYTDKLQDSNKTWDASDGGELKGKYVYIKAGTGAGQLRQILYNDIDTLYLALSWDTTPDETSQYAIYDEASLVLYMGNGIDYIQRYDGTTISELKNRPKGEYMYVYDSRVFLTGNVSLPYAGWYTAVDDPEYFPALNTFKAKGFDICSGFGEFGTSLFLFKKKSLFELVEGTINNRVYFVPKQKPNTNGCLSQHCISPVQLKGGSQLWFYDGEQMNSLGYSANFVGAILTSSVSSLIDSQMARGRTELYETEMEVTFDGRYLWISYPSVEDYNDRCIRFDTKYNVWQSRTGLNIGTFVMVDEDLYMGTSHGTEVFIMEQNQLYDGDPSVKQAIDQMISLKGTFINTPFWYKSLVSSRFLFDREDIITSAELEVVCTNALQDPVRLTKTIEIDKSKAPTLLDEGDLLDEGNELDRTDTVDTPIAYIFEANPTPFYMYKFVLRNNIIDNYFRLIAADIVLFNEGIGADITNH